MFHGCATDEDFCEVLNLKHKFVEDLCEVLRAVPTLVAQANDSPEQEAGEFPTSCAYISLPKVITKSKAFWAS